MKVSLFFLVVCLLQASRIVYVAGNKTDNMIGLCLSKCDGYISRQTLLNEAQNLTCPDGSLLGQKCYMECPDPSQVCFPMGSDIGFGSGTGHCCNVTSHLP